MSRLFEGLLVVDCASYIAAPAAASVMSDFGADVIKIEPPGAGDPYRNWPRQPVGPEDVNPGWLLDARNKKSIALDLAAAGGRDVLRRIVAGADVFITNFPLTVRKRLGLGYDDLSPLNRRLIYASFTGYGETGPESDKPGFDSTVWWARSGLMDLARIGEAQPVRSPPGAGDHPSAMAFYSSIVTALYKRERTGVGSHVGSSLLMNGVWANGCSIQAAICGEEVTRSPDREQVPMPLRNIYQCKDRKWLLLSVVPNDRRWSEFRTAMNSPLLDDPRFAPVEALEAHGGTLTGLLDSIFATRTAAEWVAVFDKHGVVHGMVATPADVAQDDQARAGGALVPMADTSMLTVSSPFWIEGESKVPPRKAPRLGQHSDSILEAAGYSVAEINGLRQQGIVT